MSFLLKIGAKALTTKLLKKVLIILAENAAKRTTTKIDDEIVKAIKEALK